MASGAEVPSLPLTRPPPHLEGNLVFHRPAKFKGPKRAFFVLLETVIYQYESRESFHRGQRSKEDFKIHLEEVCGITSAEMLMANKRYKNCSFKLTLNDQKATEYMFSAESTQEMEEWVSGLREAKEFWIEHRKRKKFLLPVSVHNGGDSLHVDKSISSSSSGNCEPVQVSVTTWDGVTRKILLPCVFDMEELLSAMATKLQNKRCASCPICKLQQSSMEVWTVTANGIGHKLDNESALDVSKHGKHFYLLVHNYKLLIIHFEDGTFQVLPCLVSLKAKEVPYLPIFADKLSSLGFSNFGLFLVNEKGTSFPFTPEEEPLKHSFQGRLILKNKALTVSSPVKSIGLEIQKQKLKKNQQNRKNQKALKRVEKEKCKQRSHFYVSNTIGEGFTPPDGLVFDYEHYGDTKRPPAVFADFVEHTDSTLASADGEDGSTERRQSFGSSSISQTAESSRDKRLVSNAGTNTSLQEEGEGEFSEGFLEIVKTSSDESGYAIQENKANVDKRSSVNTNSSVTCEHVPNDQAKESLKLPKCASENNRSPGQIQESEKCETSGRGDPASTDDRNGKAAAASSSGEKEARSEPNLTDTKLTNRSNKTSVCGDENSIIHETIEEVSDPKHHGGENEEISAQIERAESNDKTESPHSNERFARETVPADVEKTTEIHETFSGHSTLIDQSTDGPGSCVPVDIHQCDFAIVGSPHLLRLVLKVCSGHKVNEEEVGEANTFSRICLSGWHLQCKNGLWIVVERGGTHTGGDTLSSAVKIQLSEGFEALFHKEEKLWTVKENLHVANQIPNQDVNGTSPATEDSSNDVTSKDRPVTPDLSPNSASHQDPSATFPHGQSQDVSTESPTTFETHELPGSYTTTRMSSSRAESSNQEILHAAIQGIFQHMIDISGSPEEAIADTKHENTTTESICRPLCSALWNTLSVGLRKRFLVKYTVWNVVEEFKDVSSHVRRTVDWVNNRYASVNETHKFQAFVCECLNIGQGTLHKWLDKILRQDKKRLDKYYGKDGVVFHLSREKLEELVLDLSRISSLHFELHFESWVKMQGYDLNDAAFTFE
ncbi:hypothetical protein ACROYT_G021721 [Oculina patagonica]